MARAIIPFPVRFAKNQHGSTSERMIPQTLVISGYMWRLILTQSWFPLSLLVSVPAKTPKHSCVIFAAALPIIEFN